MEGTRFTAYDIHRALVDTHPEHLYEMEYHDFGEVISINDGECRVYAGEASYSDEARGALVVNDYLLGGGRSGFGGSSLLLLAAFAVAILVIVLFVI